MCKPNPVQWLTGATRRDGIQYTKPCLANRRLGAPPETFYVRSVDNVAGLF